MQQNVRSKTLEPLSSPFLRRMISSKSWSSEKFANLDIPNTPYGFLALAIFVLNIKFSVITPQTICTDYQNRVAYFVEVYLSRRVSSP